MFVKKIRNLTYSSFWMTIEFLRRHHTSSAGPFDFICWQENLYRFWLEIWHKNRVDTVTNANQHLSSYEIDFSGGSHSDHKLPETVSRNALNNVMIHLPARLVLSTSKFEIVLLWFVSCPFQSTCSRVNVCSSTYFQIISWQKVKVGLNL